MVPRVQQTLEAASAVTAIVGSGIYQAQVPEDQTRPCVVWAIVTAIPGNNLSCLPEYDDQRVQVDCWSRDQTIARQLGEAVRDALESVTHVVFGPWNSFDAESKLFRWSMDCAFLDSR